MLGKNYKLLSRFEFPLMASFRDHEKTIASPSSSSPLFTLVDWDDGHQPGGVKEGEKNPTKMAINHDKAGQISHAYYES